jgi:hypothetical protein
MVGKLQGRDIFSGDCSALSGSGNAGLGSTLKPLSLREVYIDEIIAFDLQVTDGFQVKDASSDPYEFLHRHFIIPYLGSYWR